MSNIVEIKTKPNQLAIDILKDIIEKIERCEITGISVVVENNDGTYRIEGSSTLSRLQTVGALMDLIVNRLK